MAAGRAGRGRRVRDHPASQADKRRRLGEQAGSPLARSVRFVAVDFATGSLGPPLDAAGHDPGRPTTWVWEGVIAYLRPADVAATLAALSARSAPGSRLVVNYERSNWSSRAGLLAVRALFRLTRRPSPVAGEPRRSSYTPAAMGRLLSIHGWRVRSDQDLRTIGTGAGLGLRHRRHDESSRVAVADR